MGKIAVIDICDDCPHFDNEYYDWNHWCSKLDRKIEPEDIYSDSMIPEDCPLEEA